MHVHRVIGILRRGLIVSNQTKLIIDGVAGDDIIQQQVAGVAVVRKVPPINEARPRLLVRALLIFRLHVEGSRAGDGDFYVAGGERGECGARGHLRRGHCIGGRKNGIGKIGQRVAARRVEPRIPAEGTTDGNGVAVMAEVKRTRRRAVDVRHRCLDDFIAQSIGNSVGRKRRWQRARAPLRRSQRSGFELSPVNENGFRDALCIGE